MHRLVTLTTLCFAFVACSAHADSYSFQESFEETHPFNADGTLTLSNTNGSVRIETWDKNEILISGEKAAKTEEELRLIELTIDAAPAEAAIKVKLPRRPGGWFRSNNIRARVNFTITVPATARLRDVDTTNGSITISHVRGPVHADSVNGRITAEGLSGETSLETVNGEIDAKFARVASGQKISLQTVNGAVTIALPKEASIAVQAKCVNGSIDCEFPLKLEGPVKRNRVSGTIGTGEASLNATTVNGSIRISQR